MSALNRLLCLALSLAACASAFPENNPTDTLLIPTRSIIVSGDKNAPGTPEMIAVFYNAEESYFNDPGAPRFLFLDREGRIALGIGGQIYGTLQYDFDGSIDDGASFVTYDIPVPANPARRQAFYGDASHSSIFLKMIGKTKHFGYFQAYIQTGFSGGGTGAYELKLKQAYLSLGNVTAGLTNSVFADPASTPPTIDLQGPAGQSSAKNVLIKYTPKFRNGLSAALSLEMPKTAMTGTDNIAEKIPQRVPDIPFYVQYAWSDGASHIRFSSILRTFSYRDLVSSRNRFSTGWGVQLSGMAKIPYSGFKLYYQATYGAGIGRYLNDIGTGDFDLVALNNSGRMTPPHMLALIGGVQYSFPKIPLLWSANYSFSRLYNVSNLGPDTYKRADHVATNLFYTPFDGLSFGIEYIWGRRTDYSLVSGHANRLMALVQLEF